MVRSFTVKGKVWVYPGLGGWHFVYVSKKNSELVGKRYGAGFVKVEATIGKTSWTTALFPDKKEGVYLLSIKQVVRKKEGIYDGDTIAIKCVLK